MSSPKIVVIGSKSSSEKFKKRRVEIVLASFMAIIATATATSERPAQKYVEPASQATFKDDASNDIVILAMRSLNDFDQIDRKVKSSERLPEGKWVKPKSFEKTDETLAVEIAFVPLKNVISGEVPKEIKTVAINNKDAALFIEEINHYTPEQVLSETQKQAIAITSNSKDLEGSVPAVMALKTGSQKVLITGYSQPSIERLMSNASGSSIISKSLLERVEAARSVKLNTKAQKFGF